MTSAKIACTAFAIATVLGFSTTAGAEDAPKGNVGYTTTKNISIDLGPEIPAMAGWQLRLRVLNIAPGGHIGIHNHKDRPATVYFLQGTDTVTNADSNEHCCSFNFAVLNTIRRWSTASKIPDVTTGVHRRHLNLFLRELVQ